MGSGAKVISYNIMEKFIPTLDCHLNVIMYESEI